MKENSPKKILFDSVTSHFSISVFLYQFALHLSYPLCLPISFYRHGWLFLYSQGFAPNTIGNVLFAYIIPVAFYLTIICAIISDDGIGYQAMFPIFLFVAHRLMVAFKYATLSPAEYRRILRGHNISRLSLNYSKLPTKEEIEVVKEYQQQLQLLTGWLSINEDRIVYELIAASLLCVADISASFQIPDPLSSSDNALQYQRWRRFLERNKFPTSSLRKETINDQQVNQLDLLTFCNCLMRENRNYMTSLQPITIFLSFLNAFIPYFFMFHKYSSLSTTTKIYYATSGLLNLVFYWTTSGFLLAALEDSLRRYFCSEKLSYFIRAIDIDSRFQLRFQSTNQFEELFQCQHAKIQTVLTKSESFRLSVSESALLATSQHQLHHHQQEQQQATHGTSNNGSFASFEILSPSSPPPINTPLFMTASSSPSSPIDQARKSEIATQCTTLPALRLTDHPDNIIVWMYARKLLHNFGARIRFRLDTYCGGIILLIATLILGMIYIVFIAGSSSSSSSSSKSRLELLSSPVFIQLLLWIVVFTLFQAAMIFIGHLTNKAMESHGYVISQHILLLTREISQLEEHKRAINSPSFSSTSIPELSQQQEREIDNRRDLLSNCLKTMKTTLTSVQVMDLVQPVRVLGIKCEGRTAVVMVYTLVLFLVGLLQYAYFGSFAV